MPIRWRLTLFNVMAIGTILLLLGTGLFFLLRNALLSGVEDTVQSRATAAARTIGSGEALSSEDAEQFTLDGVFVIVRDVRGNVLNETINVNSQQGGQDTVWREALRSGEPVSGTADLSEEAPDYVSAVPVTAPNGPARVVEAGKSYESAHETLETFGAILAVAIGTAFLLSIAGAYLLARTSLRPVDAVVSAAREMTEGDLSRRLPVANEGDEIGRLATTINGLIASMEAAFARREEALNRQRRFAADASHELRTPLTSISGHAKMLDEWAYEDPQTTRKGARSIRREAERMRALVEALLSLARGDDGPPLDIGRHGLGEVAAEAVEAARAATGGKVSVEYVAPDHEIEATFDRDRVRQAATILLDNAIKYTPEGGSVEVRARERDGRTMLSVSDTGIGIAEDELPLIFERFHRADTARTAGGAGLGLSIARQIAEAHGGTIEARSTLGRGSIFTLVLPNKGRGQDK